MKTIMLRPYCESKLTGEANRNCESKLKTEAVEKFKIQVQAEIESGVLKIVFLIEDPQRELDSFYPPLSQDLNLLRQTTVDRSYQMDELWKKTCFEFFVKKQNQEKYFEFNVNTLGNWNFYKFVKYRSPIQIEDKIQKMRFSFIPASGYPCDSSSSGVSKLAAEIDLNPLFRVGDELEFNFCSIVVCREQITYWSQHHSLEKPDFHDSNNFTIYQKMK